MEPGAIVGLVIGVAFIVIIVLVAVSHIRIVQQTQKCIVERLGRYVATWDTGVHFLVPFVDRIVKKVSMKEQIYDFPPQPVITKDNVTMHIDTVVFFTVTDPKLFTYGVENPIVGIEALTSTTLRNIIGDLDLDGTLTSRDIINTKMRTILDEATDPWGIKVTRVEVKNILPPKDIQNAMEKQMRAEREKREKILIAEGEKTSAITIAEGNKEAAILNAEAEKQAAIKKAEAEAEAILKVKRAEADGELMIRQAEAQGIKMINEANPSNAVLTIRSYETLAKVADGKATKMIIPSDLQNLSTMAATVTQIVENTKDNK
ncbi:MAG: SPFH/Band 7/PHB domain protein [Bacilli bacterium]|nr:SPFH/Band 7/PHB domain protein [Bacilli bacterium]